MSNMKKVVCKKTFETDKEPVGEVYVIYDDDSTQKVTQGAEGYKLATELIEECENNPLKTPVVDNNQGSGVTTGVNP